MTGPKVAEAMDSGQRQRLATWLAAHGLPLDPDTEIRRLGGGLANINCLISIGGTPFVLRFPPAGPLPPDAHDMVREHRILSRLWQTFPLAPRSLILCRDPDVIGVPFHVLEFRQGVTLAGDDPPHLAGRPDASGPLTDMLIDTLAAIHAVDAHAAGLGDLGRPEGFLARSIEGWVGRGLRLAHDDAELERALREMAAWLDRHLRGSGGVSLLHNDFKLDNILLDPVRLTPTAVLDWDMGTRGDPLFDLATLLSYWSEPGDPDCMYDLAQMPTVRHRFPPRAEVAVRYARRTGLDLAALPAQHVLAVLKLGVVFLQLNDRYRRGEVTDRRYAGFRTLGRELVDFARALAARGGGL